VADDRPWIGPVQIEAVVGDALQHLRVLMLRHPIDRRRGAHVHLLVPGHRADEAVLAHRDDLRRAVDPVVEERLSGTRVRRETMDALHHARLGERGLVDRDVTVADERIEVARAQIEIGMRVDQRLHARHVRQRIVRAARDGCHERHSREHPFALGGERRGVGLDLVR
jgi:hypothetical protein